ncbi:IS3 family transposase [Corynebacterium striatum]
MLVERISAIHRDNYGIYGVRKMWHALHRDASISVVNKPRG